MFSDQILVEKCLGGDRDAFREIVNRYQNLVCSVAYASTQNFNVSEELAQDAFIVAWDSLATLKDTSRLKSWLCGITRNLARTQCRKRTRDVLQSSTDVDAVDVYDPQAVEPAEASVAQEEIALIDSTLETLPADYREPLVLYYRERQSIRKVAEQLDLTTDTVKQRLSRGRKMLREEVTAVIERGLLRSAPGRAFTVAVVSALPVMSGTAKAASVIAGTSQGLSAAKAMGVANTAGWLTILGAITGPVAGLLGAWFGYKMSLKSARSPEEAALIKRSVMYIIVLITMVASGILVIVGFGQSIAQWNPWLLALGVMTITIGYVVGLSFLVLWQNRQIAQVRKATGTEFVAPEEIARNFPKFLQSAQYAREYTSRWSLLGLPLISVRFQGIAPADSTWKAKTAMGWIAIGDQAVGILFASGGMALGTIACGGLGCGLITFGGCAIGALSLGGLSLGLLAIGGVALGWKALGGMAIAYQAAHGGVALAREWALGGVAIAEHANNEIAKTLLANDQFFRLGELTNTFWVWGVIVGVCLVPAVLATWLVPANKDAAT